MHPKSFVGRTPPGPAGWESLQRSPDLLAGFKGPTSEEGEGKRGWGGEGREGREREWREGEALGPAPTQFLATPLMTETRADRTATVQQLQTVHEGPKKVKPLRFVAGNIFKTPEPLAP